MEKINDGGAAFPLVATSDNFPQRGMSLRDWFAGQALAGLCANPQNAGVALQLAECAFIHADAMLLMRGMK